MFLFKRYHHFGYGLAVAVISTILLMIGGTQLAAISNAGQIGIVVVSLVLFAVGFTTTALEHRNTLVANSYISIIGKSFYAAGLMVFIRFLDPYPWYLSLPVLILVVLVPFLRYPKNFFWAYSPGGKLA